MKKLIASLMSIGMMCTANVTGFTEGNAQLLEITADSNNETTSSQSSTIEYKNLKSTYSITIPVTIAASKEGEESGADNGKVVATISAPVLAAPAVIDQGKVINVKLTELGDTPVTEDTNGVLSLKKDGCDNTKIIEGTVTVDGANLSTGNNTLLTVQAGATVDLGNGKAVIWKSNDEVNVSGTYSNTITYTSSIDDAT